MKAAILQIARLTPEKKAIADERVGRGSLVMRHGDICEASEEIILSSDDNEFTARGGVSQAILEKRTFGYSWIISGGKSSNKGR
jgi:hypothetical protein